MRKCMLLSVSFVAIPALPMPISIGNRAPSVKIINDPIPIFVYTYNVHYVPNLDITIVLYVCVGPTQNACIEFFLHPSMFFQAKIEEKPK